MTEFLEVQVNVQLIILSKWMKSGMDFSNEVWKNTATFIWINLCVYIGQNTVHGLKTGPLSDFEQHMR